ncbi:MAG: DUF998 domain-containing protein [Ktedonobacteraceae bacterium]|nr:DUF998 domain-containing protein [Ktedonobacteraceae bacterium]
MNTLSRHSDDDATAPKLVEGSTKSVARTTQQATRWLALGAIAGPILFTLTWIILGFLSPGYTAWGVRIAPYSSISQGISGLGLGVTAPFMNTAFVLSGILILAGVVGIFQGMREMDTLVRWVCTVLLALLPLGMAIDGIFTLESFLPHMMGFLLAVGSPVLSFVVIGLLFRRISSMRQFGNWLILGSPLTLVLIILYFLTFSPTVEGTQSGIAGLTERILVVEVLAWFVVMGLRAFRQPSQSVHSRGLYL